MHDEQICRLLEVMPDAVVLMREDSAIAFVNSQAATLLGYTPDELVGRPLETIVPERFRQRHAARSTAYLTRPVVRPMGGSLDLWALCKTGREVARGHQSQPHRNRQWLAGCGQHPRHLGSQERGVGAAQRPGGN